MISQVHQWMFSTSRDIMIYLWRYDEYIGGVQYIGGISIVHP